LKFVFHLLKILVFDWTIKLSCWLCVKNIKYWMISEKHLL
jgi:hypothetical protein